MTFSKLPQAIVASCPRWKKPVRVSSNEDMKHSLTDANSAKPVFVRTSPDTYQSAGTSEAAVSAPPASQALTYLSKVNAGSWQHRPRGDGGIDHEVLFETAASEFVSARGGGRGGEQGRIRTILGSEGGVSRSEGWGRGRYDFEPTPSWVAM